MAQNRGQKIIVLLVDDDSAVRESVGRALTVENYHVVPSGSSTEALQEFARNPIDLAIVDVNLGAENGWELVGRLSDARPAMPVIVVSAWPELLGGTAAPMAAFTMEKPLDLGRLLAQMRDLTAGTSKPARL